MAVKKNRNEAAVKVFVVQHVHEMPDGSEDVKMIGIYPTRAAGLAAVRRLRKQPGFKKSPKGFSVDGYLLGMDHWTEGFVTIPRAT